MLPNVTIPLSLKNMRRIKDMRGKGNKMINSETFFKKQRVTIFFMAYNFVGFVDMTEYYTLAVMHYILCSSGESRVENTR